jgi:hypothetical protein
LFLIIALGFVSSKTNDFSKSRQLSNPLVVENIQLQVEDVDHLRLKDALKLGWDSRLSFPSTKSMLF